MRNRAPGICADCGGMVHVGAGYFEKIMGTTRGWKVRHVLCVAIAKLEAGVSFNDLSRAQQKAMEPYMK